MIETAAGKLYSTAGLARCRTLLKLCALPFWFPRYPAPKFCLFGTCQLNGAFWIWLVKWEKRGSEILDFLFRKAFWVAECNGFSSAESSASESFRYSNAATSQLRCCRRIKSAFDVWLRFLRCTRQICRMPVFVRDEFARKFCVAQSCFVHFVGQFVNSQLLFYLWSFLENFHA